VPCYNVEKYVDKCISSIIEQTYPNLEILLINDGSTDSTGKKCDEWQERDSRIRVIHKQNEGLPYARKTGIEHTTAEFVTFVDSDDWIDVNMYNNMMEALVTTGSDIAQCGVCEVFEDGRFRHRESELKTGKYEIVGRVEGVLLIVGNKKWYSWMWNKIFKKHLFDNIVFPREIGYGEDFIIAHHLFHKANQSIYFSDEYCYYLQRNDSISRSSEFSNQLKKHNDFFEVLYDRLCFLEKYPEYHSALSFYKLWFINQGIPLLRNILIFPNSFKIDCYFEKSKQLRSVSLTKKEKLKKKSIKIEFYILKFTGTTGYKIFRKLYITIINITNRLKITNRKTYALYWLD